MKKILYSAAAALLFTLSIPVTQAAAKTSADFSDLKDLDAATKAKFDAMISAGIFDGVQEQQFGLQEQMNRAQFAKIAALILKLEVNSDLKTSSFKDVKGDDPANGYALPFIEALKKAGITQGDGSSAFFNPSGNVTKEQLAAFLVRALNIPTSNTNHNDDHGKVSAWASRYVETALQYKLIVLEQNNPGWQSNANRGDLVLSSYEAKTQLDPLKLVSASVTEQHELTLSFSASLQESQVDLSKILIGGKALDKTKAHFKLSEDGKTLTIIFDEPLSPELLSQPAISINGLESITKKQLKTDTPVPVEKANLLPSKPPVVIPPSSYSPPSSSGGGYVPPADTTAPQLITAKRQGSENSIVLTFSEALNETLAGKSESYKLEVKGETASSFEELPEGAVVQVSSDKKQVTITFPESFTINDAQYTVPSYFTGNVGIQVSGLKDLSGNVITQINKPVEIVNPGLIGEVSFVKPDNTNDNYNKTKPVIIGPSNPNESALHKYKYVVAESATPVIIGLPYNSGINGDLWEGSSSLDEAPPISIEGNKRIITVIDYYNDEHNEEVNNIVYGYKSFEISENQVLREAHLSEPITFTEEPAGVWKASFQSPTNGHSYYYQVDPAPVQVNLGHEYLENSQSWINLTPEWTIQAMSNSYVTVIEVIPEELSEGTSHKIIAYQSFKLTSAAPNTPTN